jgi:hypothetical protein
MPFAAPVLAERAHVAERAQRSSVRRKAGDAGARTLGDAVSSQLRPLNVDPGSVEWDAWRREDGRWSLTASYASGKRKGTATFAYDAPGNFVVTENDDARWLVGEAVAAPAAAPRDDLSQARRRRLAAVSEDELPLGDDAIELANRPADEANATTEDLTDAVARVRDADLSPTPEPLADEPVHHEPVHHEPALHEPALREPERAAEEAGQGAEPEPEAPAAEKPARAKRRGRASVPSWDEIMFGGGKHD